MGGKTIKTFQNKEAGFFLEKQIENGFFVA
jgi:hypothetical protein